MRWSISNLHMFNTYKALNQSCDSKFYVFLAESAREDGSNRISLNITCIQQTLSSLIQCTKRGKKEGTGCCMSEKSWPILYGNLLNKMGLFGHPEIRLIMNFVIWREVTFLPFPKGTTYIQYFHLQSKQWYGSALNVCGSGSTKFDECGPGSRSIKLPNCFLTHFFKTVTKP